MKRIKVSEATGPALDWMVWMCAGGADAYPRTASGAAFLKLWKGNSAKYVHPSTDWSQGGPIIDREKKAGSVLMTADRETCQVTIIQGAKIATAYGPTPLIAFTRCFVTFYRSDKVEVPEELV